jgi:hypothetical protein
LQPSAIRDVGDGRIYALHLVANDGGSLGYVVGNDYKFRVQLSYCRLEGIDRRQSFGPNFFGQGFHLAAGFAERHVQSNQDACLQDDGETGKGTEQGREIFHIEEAP